MRYDAKKGVISIDAGTTGTRAALVMSDGSIEQQSYFPLEVQNPTPGVVEQDFAEIWNRTRDAVQDVLAHAKQKDITVVSLAIATQRSTSGLWDRETGQPLCPAMVWQDSRYADELSKLGETWNATLLERIGRTAGIRSPYYWAAQHIEKTPEVAEAFKQNKLMFGTVDTWLLWNITGGKVHGVSTTNAVAAGAYDAERSEYLLGWIEALGFPLEILPRVVPDAGDISASDKSVIGDQIPIRALIGDQHAALVGLGCLEPGDSSCIHGTGTFVDQIVGGFENVRSDRPEAVVRHVGWEDSKGLTQSVECFTATTGSALNWVCDQLEWFEDAQEISRMTEGKQPWDPAVPIFLPTLTGVRLPRVEPDIRGALGQLSLATTRTHLAQSLLQGIAQCVAMSVEANTMSTGEVPTSIRVGGGLSQSDSLLQMQADLTGIPMLRFSAADKTSLRGAAFLAGVGTLWSDLKEAVTTLGKPQIFSPQIDTEERRFWAQRWRSFLMAETNQHKYRQEEDGI
ncbi:MAG TPA: glycerol kinase [Enteractinococcus helveticum]|uniref:Glycerol kinase n=1 Tax=Enteractinococcus helveticum TaxID=1837282 RepID=A0A921FP99_9MICC|nr:FGGY family carbohydrate kinase [Enteractinococcus helveticum]HJF15724.1 glycerol kinase [Enteractinococcus helveticum]